MLIFNLKFLYNKFVEAQKSIYSSLFGRDISNLNKEKENNQNFRSSFKNFNKSVDIKV